MLELPRLPALLKLKFYLTILGRITPIRQNKIVSSRHRILLSLISSLFLFLVLLAIFLTFAEPIEEYWHTMPFSSPTLPESLVEYRRYLQEDYYTDPYPLYSSLVYSDYRPKYPINLVLVHRDKYENDSAPIERQMLLYRGNVDKLREKEISIKMEEIGSLDGGKTAAHFVLIEGDPGIGKSTLCWQLCRLWRAKGNKLQHKWDLMVIIELRDKNARKASNLYELLYHPDDNTRQAIARDIEKREGKGLLLFLDGYDELSEFQHSEFSVIHKILINKLLSKATVVVPAGQLLQLSYLRSLNSSYNST